MLKEGGCYIICSLQHFIFEIIIETGWNRRIQIDFHDHFAIDDNRHT